MIDWDAKQVMNRLDRRFAANFSTLKFSLWVWDSLLYECRFRVILRVAVRLFNFLHPLPGDVDVIITWNGNGNCSAAICRYVNQNHRVGVVSANFARATNMKKVQ